jgi:alpha-N-arabinofuranosidase
VVSPGTGRVEFVYPAPNLPENPWPIPPTRENFDEQVLAPHWIFLRTPPNEFLSLDERPGYLRLRLRPQRLSEPTNPSFVGRRQQHIHFSAQTSFEFVPRAKHECAGLAILQNNDFHFLLIVTQTDRKVVRLIKRAYGKEEILAEQPADSECLYLKVDGHEQSYNFYLATEPEEWRPIAENLDGRILSTPVAGGFVGACIAMYASSNGRPSTNNADFDWFEYVGLDEA